jgi:hypothetical protein
MAVNLISKKIIVDDTITKKIQVSDIASYKINIPSGSYICACNGETLTDLTGRHTFSIEFQTNAILDATTYKFGSKSLRFKNDTGDFQYGVAYLANNFDDFQLLNSLSGDMTISYFFKPISCSDNTLVRGCGHFGSVYSSNYFYDIQYKYSASVLYPSTYLGGGTIPFNVSEWTHIAIIKKDAASGVYVNGVQKSYRLNTSTIDCTPFVSTGCSGWSFIHHGRFYGSGNVDDFVVMRANLFNANPNSGKTDTIIVPTSPLAV